MSTLLEPAVSSARTYALKVHADQRYGTRPYAFHLDAVASVLMEYGHSDVRVLQAAYLHDTVEDCEGIDAEALRAEGYEAGVVSAVLFCSDEEGPNRKARKRLTYARWRQTIEAWRAAPGSMAWVPDAMRVKLADRLANVRQCVSDANKGLHEMYRKERETFRGALHAEGVADTMWAEYERILEPLGD